MFVVRSVRTGERISQVNIVREITRDSPLRENAGERFDHCACPDNGVVLWGWPHRHINHSCDPNAYESFEEQCSYLVARRDISAGEEITCDYNINITNGTRWPCRCAPRCPGEVIGDFFRLSTQRQREYRPLLARWFVNRHRDQIERSTAVE